MPRQALGVRDSDAPRRNEPSAAAGCVGRQVSRCVYVSATAKESNCSYVLHEHHIHAHNCHGSDRRDGMGLGFGQARLRGIGGSVIGWESGRDDVAGVTRVGMSRKHV